MMTVRDQSPILEEDTEVATTTETTVADPITETAIRTTTTDHLIETTDDRLHVETTVKETTVTTTVRSTDKIAMTATTHLDTYLTRSQWTKVSATQEPKCHRLRHTSTDQSLGPLLAADDLTKKDPDEAAVNTDTLTTNNSASPLELSQVIGPTRDP